MYKKVCPNCGETSYRAWLGEWACPCCRNNLDSVAPQEVQHEKPQPPKPHPVPPATERGSRLLLVFLCEICLHPHSPKTIEEERKLLEFDYIRCGFCNQTTRIPHQLKQDIRGYRGWE